MSEQISPSNPQSSLPSARRWLQKLEAWETLPDEEQEVLVDALADSIELALGGRVEAGEEYLLTGLHRAEDLWKGSPWGGDLVQCYQSARDCYRRTYEPHPNR